jgi:dipeptidyl aminopeptidase/acylaminoacyl peptidase
MDAIRPLMGVLATLALAGAAGAQQPPSLIPRAALFGGAQRANVSESPDGRWLAWLAPAGGVTNVWVAPIDDLSRARPATRAATRPIPVYGWTPDSSTLLYLADEAGNENFVLYGVDLATGAVRNYTPYKGAQVGKVDLSRSLRGRGLIRLNNRTPAWHDVYEVNFHTGELKLVKQNDGFIDFVADDRLKLRLAIRARADGGRDYLRMTEGVVEQAPMESVAYDDVATTAPVSFDRAGRVLYWLDSRGRDRAALVAQDFATGRTRVVAEPAGGAIETPTADPKTGRVDGYVVNDLRRRWVGLAPSTRADLAFLQDHLPGPFIIAPRPDRDDRWILTEDPVSGPPSAWRYDRAARRLTKLFSLDPDLDDAPLAEMHPVEIRSRDGLRMVSYLTLPRGSASTGSAADGALRPFHPLPLVLWVHGGPADRDNYRFEPIHQWLANRGYAVLSVNFRGSTGFGKRFLTAGDFEWGAGMQDDLDDAVDWAVKAGIADPRKVAIFGGSYGGYAVLAGLAFTPDRFACGIDMFGPSDLASAIQTFPAYWTPRRAELLRKVGDPATREGAERLKARSPLMRADAVRAPLLVGQGANDVRVNKTQSDKMVAALQQRNVPVTYLVFGDEGHGFRRPQNNLAFMAVAEQFLAKCLGGPAEPIGDSLKASTVQAQAGAAYVPGLAEALRARAASAGPPDRGDRRPAPLTITTSVPRRRRRCADRCG